MEAHISIAGNVGGNVDFKESPDYEGRAAFSIACTPRVRRSGAWVDGTTTWYRVTAWRRLALHVRDSINKGDAVIVGGRLSTQHWLDAHGEERVDFTIEADWVGHDLRRGKATFERERLRPQADAPEHGPASSQEEREQVAVEQVEVVAAAA